MATEVVMPQMGESIAEGTITKWLVKVGDKVDRDQPLFEISTDKVDAEIPSPAAGSVVEILHKEGETVPVGQTVARIGEAGEQPAAGATAAAPKPAAQPQQPAAQAEPAAPAAAKEPAAVAAREEKGRDDAGATPAPQPQAASAPSRPIAVPSPPPAEPGSLEERVRKYSSPLVRKMAQVEGVSLEELTGSGIHGRVTKRDLEAYLEERKSRPAPTAVPAARPAAAAAAASAPAGGGFHVPAYVQGEEVEIEPMSKIREITAAHMAYSKHTSAHVTTMFHFDMTRVDNLRKKVKDKFFAAHGTKLTYMPFIFAAIAAALRQHKKLNASIDGTNVVYKKHINLGMAVAMDRGLIVPVIKDADQKNLAGLAKTANDLADRGRAKKLLPDELKGGTFTITNPGVFGSLFGTPIINQPQVAIMGIGTIEKRQVVRTDEDGSDTIAIRTMSYFGITYDHRLVDGADADHFMNDVKKVLEQGDWPELQPFL
ncbi:MAG TPA: 2-oxoglutarate dehydrogenase, E2 component, dihydrolipoamide succinyltransferase [Thermoanaerobaculia bacterium]|nr:2-oxoglutarate dehydrogenase, E2 component, dihydrolipoamide succinyltransferase [Thermoanaerobaculia bacterium]